MDKWSAIRFTGYTASALAGMGWLLHVAGFAVYDASAQTIDLYPVSVVWLAGIIGPVLASIVAPLAIYFGWGSKQ